jgi:hypothetical protein
MKPKKSSKLSKKDKDWQKKVEERIKREKVEFNHPKGRERFVDIIQQLSRKKDRN